MESLLSPLKKILEAVLFATRKPLTLEELSNLLEADSNEVQKAIEELTTEYQDKGIKVLSVSNGYLMGTDPDCGTYVDRLFNIKIETTLSPQSMETLAIVAYKQPITKAEIERIRGLYSDGTVATLLDKGLIEEKGKAESLGRPRLYGTTEEFLRHFGLKDLMDLPELNEDELVQSKVFEVALK